MGGLRFFVQNVRKRVSDESLDYYDVVPLGRRLPFRTEKKANNNYQEVRKCPERANEYSPVIYRRGQRAQIVYMYPAINRRAIMMLSLWDAW